MPVRRPSGHGRSPFASARVLGGLSRRGRIFILCSVISLIYLFSLVHDPAALSHDDDDNYFPAGSTSFRHDLQYLSVYLEVNLPWSNPRPAPVKAPVPTKEADAIVQKPQRDDVPLGVHKDHGHLGVHGGALDMMDGSWSAEASASDRDHEWRLDGLLAVNTRGSHPIYELVRRAEAQWEEKHKRASKTLKQAVKEYKRRYNRAPPVGFDHWWRYVQEHDVKLPDEYDQIYRDLEPYWGIDPTVLSKSQQEREIYRDSWTIGKTQPEGRAVVLNHSLPEGQTEDFLKWGAYPQLELMGDLWEYVPPFRANFNPHDAPSQRLDWTWKAAALVAANRGEYLSRDKVPPRNRKGFAAMCPPGSLAFERQSRNIPFTDSDAMPPPPRQNKTFIYDHEASMDICQHPHLISIHGIFLSGGMDFDTYRFPTPQFCNSATPLHGDIHAISSYMSDEFAWDDPKWEDKDDDRLLWRGGPTGMKLQEKPGIDWRGAHRLRFVNLTSGRRGVDEPITYLRPSDDASAPTELSTVTRQRGVVNKAMMDVGFSTDYLNCAGEVCEIIEQDLGERRPRMSHREAGKYKYVFDVDGNGWSARFRRLMSMHSVVFKASVYSEWFSARIQPWVHYVPVQIDYSDLYDSVAFFAGDVDGEGAHDEMAKRIGAQGREWVTKYWRREDMVAYMFRLWLEYARLMSPNRNEMNFVLPP